MNRSLYTDREHLTKRMYATDELLALRIQTHKLYTRPEMDFASWVLDHIPWRGDEVVLDIGCGAGLYVEPVHDRLKQGGRLLLGDLSFGMLLDVAKSSSLPANLLNGDAMHLPLPGECCDIVLANHMLYHLPSMDLAVIEAHRVLRPGGFLLAATNARDSMRGFVRLVQSAALALGYPIEVPESPVLIKFNLETGLPLIKNVFSGAKIFKFDSALVFPSPEPAIAYVKSLAPTYKALLPEELSWEAVLEEARRQIASIVATRGEFLISKTTGLFVATKGDRLS